MRLAIGPLIRSPVNSVSGGVNAKPDAFILVDYKPRTYSTYGVDGR